MKKEVLGGLLAVLTLLGIRKATARPAPPTPPESPAGSIALEALTTERTVIAKVTVRASAGTLPITAEVHCTFDSAEKTETVTITELGKDYTVEFSFPVTESGTYTVKAWAVLRNAVGEATVGPQWQTIPVEVYKPFTITVRAVADSTEVKVTVIGEYPSGTYTTPFEITITEDLKGKGLGFWFPAVIELDGVRYEIASVTNGYIDKVEADRALVRFLADEAKEVVVRYSESAALAQWSSGRGSWVKVWDAWYREEKKLLTKVEILDYKEEYWTEELYYWVADRHVRARKCKCYLKVRLIEGSKPYFRILATYGVVGVRGSWNGNIFEGWSDEIYVSDDWVGTREGYPRYIEVLVGDMYKRVSTSYRGVVELSVTKKYMGIDATFKAIGDEDVKRYWVFNDPVNPARDMTGDVISGLVFYITSGHVRKEWEAKSKSDIEIQGEWWYSDYPEGPGAWFVAIKIPKDRIREV